MNTNLLSIISQQFIDFAKRYELDTWDWISFVVLVLSFVIAIIALFVSKRNLFFQKRTEKNTQPIMTESVQLFLIGQKLRSVLDSYCFLFSLHYILGKTQCNAYPSSHFWKYVKIESGDLNESLFYYSKEKYIAFHSLIEAHDVFASDVDSLKKLIENPQTDKKDIICEFLHAYNEIGLLIKAYLNTLNVCYKFKREDVEAFFEDNFFNNNDTNYFVLWCNRNNISTKEGVRYIIEDTDSKDYLFPHLLHFSRNALQACSCVVKHDEKQFSEFLMLNINVLLMNTCYKWESIDISKKTEKTDDLKKASGKIFRLGLLPINHIGWQEAGSDFAELLKTDFLNDANFHYWFFYMIEHKKNTV